MSPNAHPRRILLAVTGLSPQIVTETLYALAVRGQPQWIPTEIHLVTTARGADNARLKLLSQDPGWFHRLCADYYLPLIAFDERHIHVIPREDGNPLDDIRDDADNQRAADFITETVRRLSHDTDTELHASIAGGRKSMGFYLGYAMSLYGRPQDRLSHVLVSAPFESHPEFYYPTPTTRVITSLDRAQDALDTARAEVWLGDIPFVRLRHGLPKELLEGQTRFSEVVAAVQTTLGPPLLTLDLHHRQIHAAGHTLKLPPAQLALLVLFARRAQRGESPLQGPIKDAPDPAWRDLYLSEYRALKAEFDDLDATERALAKGMEGDYFQQLLSKLNRKLKTALGTAALPYLIVSDNGRPRRRYALRLPPEAVRFAAAPATSTSPSQHPIKTCSR